MPVGECPFANEQCKWYDRPPRARGAEVGCYADRDHIVPQRLAKTALARLYIYSPDNIQDGMCRDAHDEKTAAGDEPLPDRETMLESLQRQVRLGIYVVSRQSKRRIMKGTI
jgi:hypothetical protein